jgi:hypothetical protein
MQTTIMQRLARKETGDRISQSNVIRNLDRPPIYPRHEGDPAGVPDCPA